MKKPEMFLALSNNLLQFIYLFFLLQFITLIEENY